MSDKKLSAYTRASLPLVSTDLFPYIHNPTSTSSNETVSINDLDLRFAQPFSVTGYGAKGDGKRVQGVTCTSTSKLVTVANASFTFADVGKLCLIFDQAAAGTPTTIASIVSSTQVNLTANAGITRSDNNTFFAYGTDDSAAITSCLTAASANLIVPNATAAPNIPIGLGLSHVVIPATSGEGFYLLGSQVTIPSGIRLDCPAMLLNCLTNRFIPCMVISPYVTIPLLSVECALGTGLEAGTDNSQEAEIHLGDIRLWNVGTDISGTNQYQDALVLNGYLFSIERLFIKGGTRGLVCSGGSDLTAKHVFAIGCTAGVYLTGSNQVNIANLFLDTNKTNGFYDGGVIIDNGCSDIYIRLQVFEFQGLNDTVSPVVSIGQLTAVQNTYIVLDIMCNNSGGTIVGIDYGTDIMINIFGSNTKLPVGSANPTLTAVAYGTHMAGVVDITAVLDSTITPSTGTIYGRFVYSKSNQTVFNNGVTINQSLTAQHGFQVVLDESTGAKQAAYLRNLTNWAVVTGLTLLELVNGTDTGYVLKLKNAGTGNFLTLADHTDVVKFYVDYLGVVYPVKATTVQAPPYIYGGIYFDTTLNKLRIGGATGWETITSA